MKEITTDYIKDYKKNIFRWKIVEPFETDYCDQYIEKSLHWIRRMAIFGILVFSILPFFHSYFNVPSKTAVLVIILVNLLLLLGLLVTFLSKEARRRANYVTIFLAAAFVLAHMLIVVPILEPGMKKGVIGLMIGVSLVIYSLETIDPRIAIISGIIIGSTYTGSYLINENYNQSELYQAIWQFSLINVFGFMTCMINTRRTRMEFLLNLLLEDQYKVSDGILRQVFPSQIVDRISENDTRIADYHENVSIIFADIVRFTPFSSKHPPGKVVSILDELFSTFDEIVERHGVEKIKTIGDCYMAACGCPEEDGQHAHKAASASIEMRDHMSKFIKEKQIDIDITIGIHSGPVVAGVIGHSRFGYDIWGDSVNIAARLESIAEEKTIRISEETANLIRDQYEVIGPEEKNIKGKGILNTYLLVGKKS